MQVGGTSMLLVYPKFYFLPITKDRKFNETELYREEDELETMANVKIGHGNEEWHKKLLEEIDEEFINEELIHIR